MSEAEALPSASHPDLLRLLSEVADPEIPAVSVVDLGIVREATLEGVAITPTYTGCPATEVITRLVRDKLDAGGFAHVPVRMRLVPAWTTDWISAAGRDKLRAYGIAPPPPGDGRASLRTTPAECPRCASVNTEELSRFGSTPCKALWRCLSCREPFDRFKCL